MLKKQLSVFPIRDAMPEEINLAKRMNGVKYFVSAAIHCCKGKKILLLHFYDSSNLSKNSGKAEFRTFISKNDYITQDTTVSTVKWKTGAIKNILGYCCYRWEKETACLDVESEKAILSFLNAKENPFLAIQMFQDKIMEKRLRAKHKKITDRIDSYMVLTPKLPKGFQKWVDITGMAHSRYVFYFYRKGKMTQQGYCTFCHKEVEVFKPRHNISGICPHCKKQIVFKAIRKAGRVIDRGAVAVLQKINGGLIARYFTVTKTYENIREPEISYLECERTLYFEDKIKQFEWAEFRQTGKVRWCDDVSKYYFDNVVLYSENLKETLADTKYQFCALQEFATRWEGALVNVNGYLTSYLKIPFIEYLTKLRLYRLTEEITGRRYFSYCGLNVNGKTLQEILGVRKKQLSLLQKLNVTSEELEVLQEAEKVGYEFTAEEFRELFNKYGKYALSNIVRVMKYVSFNKILKYIESRDTKNLQNVVSDWKDYISFCEKLGYDLKNEFVLFPRHLKKAHDTAYKMVQSLERKERNKKYQRLSKETATYFQNLQQKIGWENEKYVVMAPKNLFEIITEGHKLHHCVGNYAESAAQGETIILFLRKKENLQKPFYTMEVQGEEILQCRGFNNKGMDEDIRKVIQEFQKKVLLSQQRKMAV